MKKKEIQKKVVLSEDDDFSFDGADFDMGDDLGMNLEESEFGQNNRKPITRVGNILAKTVGDAVTDRQLIREVIDEKLPSEVNTTLQSFDEIGSGVASVYGEVQKNLKPGIESINKTLRKVISKDSKLLPKWLNDKLTSKVEEYEYAKVAGVEEQRNNFISAQLSELMQQTNQNQATQVAMQTATTAEDRVVETDRFNISSTILRQISESSKSTELFHRNFYSTAAKKSLEVQYKSLFALQDILQHHRENSKAQITQLAAIAKNTALPDYVKYRGVEVTKELLRRKFTEKTLDPIVTKGSDITKKLFQNLTKAVGEKARDISDNIMSLTDTIEMLKGSKEMDASGFNDEIASSILGMLVGGKIKSAAKKGFGILYDKFESSSYYKPTMKGLRKTDAFLRNAPHNAKALLSDSDYLAQMQTGADISIKEKEKLSELVKRYDSGEASSMDSGDLQKVLEYKKRNVFLRALDSIKLIASRSALNFVEDYGDTLTEGIVDKRKNVNYTQQGSLNYLTDSEEVMSSRKQMEEAVTHVIPKFLQNILREITAIRKNSVTDRSLESVELQHYDYDSKSLMVKDKIIDKIRTAGYDPKKAARLQEALSRMIAAGGGLKNAPAKSLLTAIMDFWSSDKSNMMGMTIDIFTSQYYRRKDSSDSDFKPMHSDAEAWLVRNIGESSDPGENQANRTKSSAIERFKIINKYWNEAVQCRTDIDPRVVYKAARMAGYSHEMAGEALDIEEKIESGKDTFLKNKTYSFSVSKENKSISSFFKTNSAVSKAFADKDQLDKIKKQQDEEQARFAFDRAKEQLAMDRKSSKIRARLNGLETPDDYDHKPVDTRVEENKKKRKNSTQQRRALGGPVHSPLSAGVDTTEATTLGKGVVLAGDEHIVTADEINTLGGGDTHKGHELMSKLRSKIRNVKAKLGVGVNQVQDIVPQSVNNKAKAIYNTTKKNISAASNLGKLNIYSKYLHGRLDSGIKPTEEQLLHYSRLVSNISGETPENISLAISSVDADKLSDLLKDYSVMADIKKIQKRLKSIESGSQKSKKIITARDKLQNKAKQLRVSVTARDYSAKAKAAKEKLNKIKEIDTRPNQRVVQFKRLGKTQADHEAQLWNQKLKASQVVTNKSQFATGDLNKAELIAFRDNAKAQNNASDVKKYNDLLGPTIEQRVKNTFKEKVELYRDKLTGKNKNTPLADISHRELAVSVNNLLKALEDGSYYSIRNKDAVAPLLAKAMKIEDPETVAYMLDWTTRKSLVKLIKISLPFRGQQDVQTFYRSLQALFESAKPTAIKIREIYEQGNSSAIDTLFTGPYLNQFSAANYPEKPLDIGVSQARDALRNAMDNIKSLGVNDETKEQLHTAIAMYTGVSLNVVRKALFILPDQVLETKIKVTESIPAFIAAIKDPKQLLSWAKEQSTTLQEKLQLQKRYSTYKESLNSLDKDQILKWGRETASNVSDKAKGLYDNTRPYMDLSLLSKYKDSKSLTGFNAFAAKEKAVRDYNKIKDEVMNFSSRTGIEVRQDTDVKDGFLGADIYISGQTKPVMTYKDIRSGRYIDMQSGKIITKTSDITGDIIDSQSGEIVVKAEELTQLVHIRLDRKTTSAGMFVKRGLLSGLVPVGVSAAKLAGSRLSMIAKGQYQATDFIKDMLMLPINTADFAVKFLLDRPTDIYLSDGRGATVGEPILTKRKMKDGEYYNANGSPIFKPSDIKGIVLDQYGDVIIGRDELKQGICYKNGKPVKGPWARVISAALNLALKPAKVALKATWWMAKKANNIAGWMLGKGTRGLFNLQRAPGSVEETQTQVSIFSAQQLHAINKGIEQINQTQEDAISQAKKKEVRKGSWKDRLFGKKDKDNTTTPVKPKDKSEKSLLSKAFDFVKTIGPFIGSIGSALGTALMGSVFGRGLMALIKPLGLLITPLTAVASGLGTFLKWAASRLGMGALVTKAASKIPGIGGAKAAPAAATTAAQTNTAKTVAKSATGSAAATTAANTVASGTKSLGSKLLSGTSSAASKLASVKGAIGIGLLHTATDYFADKSTKSGEAATIATGALAGAATGAAIGSILGPVGTIVGAGVGAGWSLWSDRKRISGLSTRITRLKHTSIRAVRYAGYGFTGKSAEIMHDALSRLEYLSAQALVGDNTTFKIKPMAFGMDVVVGTLGLNPKDPQALRDADHWFMNRFKPFFESHVNALIKSTELVSEKIIESIDLPDTLKSSEKSSYIAKVLENAPKQCIQISLVNSSILSGYVLCNESELHAITQAYLKGIDLNSTRMKTAAAVNKTQTTELQTNTPYTKPPIPTHTSSGRGTPFVYNKDMLNGRDSVNEDIEVYGSDVTGGTNLTGQNKSVSTAAYTGTIPPLLSAKGGLYSGANAKPYIVLAKGSDGLPATLEGLVPEFKSLLFGMIEEYGTITGKRVQINSGYRSNELQAKLYAKMPGKAARPGSSPHNFGFAVDINTVDVDAMEKLGLMRKYGLCRPLSGESWHIEPIGIQLDYPRCKMDMAYARKMIAASPGRGGSGPGDVLRNLKGKVSRIKEMLVKIWESAVAYITDDKPKDGSDVLPATAKPDSQGRVDMSSKYSVAAQKKASESSATVPNNKEISISPYSKPTVNKVSPNEDTEKDTARLSGDDRVLDKKPSLQRNMYANAVDQAQGVLPKAKPSPGLIGEGSKPDTDIKPPTNKEEIKESIVRVSQSMGVNPDTSLLVAQLESSMGQNVSSKTSSAKGIFQFTDATWSDAVKYYIKRHGPNAGVTEQSSPLDHKASILVGIDFIKTRLKKGMDVAQLYLRHLLGDAGYSTLMNGIKQSKLPYEAVSKSAAMANKSLFFNRGDVQTPYTSDEFFHNLLNVKFSKAAADAGISSVPTLGTQSVTTPAYRLAPKTTNTKAFTLEQTTAGSDVKPYTQAYTPPMTIAQSVRQQSAQNNTPAFDEINPTQNAISPKEDKSNASNNINSVPSNDSLISAKSAAPIMQPGVQPESEYIKKSYDIQVDHLDVSKLVLKEIKQQSVYLKNLLEVSNRLTDSREAQKSVAQTAVVEKEPAATIQSYRMPSKTSFSGSTVSTKIADT